MKTVELVYVDGLLRTGGDPSLGGHLLDVGLLSNSSRMCGQSGQWPDSHQTSMGAEWASSHS